MHKKIYGSMMLLTVVSLILCGSALCAVFYRQLSGTVRSDVRERAIIIANVLARSQQGYGSPQAEDMRVTILAPDGQVLYDDDESIAAMGNHADREEIKKALATGAGESRRFSHTLGRETYYYAVRMDNGDILRLAKTTDSIVGILLNIFPYVALIIVLVIFLGYLFAGRLTKRIVAPINEIDPASARTVPYEELVPFARTVRNQRKQLDTQLQYLKGRTDTINAIMEHMQEGMALIDGQGTVLLVNQSILSILGCTPSVQGKHVIELLRDVELYGRIQDALKGRHGECIYEHLGRVYQAYFSPSEDNGAILLFLDVTERLRGERLRREFSANVSHELRTPLASISAYAEMIAGGMVKEGDIVGFGGKIRDEAGRLIALIEDIMMLSRLDEKGGMGEREPVQLTQLAREVAASLEHKASEAEVTLTVQGSDTEVVGSASMLYEMILNLADNGIKYNRPGGCVALSVSRRQGQTVLTVSDTGIGIPREHLHRVFERFYRVDASRSKKTGGTGLGLSIVKHIAAAHGATLDIDSTEAKGTTITVAFPD